MSQAAYLRDLREIARGYWLDVFSQDEFFDAMFGAIDTWLRIAWQEGAKSAGIMPDEITPAEQVQLSGIIFKEYMFVPKLAQFIQQNSKANGGLLRTVQARLVGWAARYKDVYTRASLTAKNDPKKIWVLGPTEKHCPSCSKLAGKVKRQSWWLEHVQPQNYPNPSLTCGGWRCLCRLEDTDLPLSKGRMPNVP